MSDFFNPFASNNPFSNTRIYPIGYPLTFSTESNSWYIIERAGENVMITREEYNMWVELYETWKDHGSADPGDPLISSLLSKKVAVAVDNTDLLCQNLQHYSPLRQGFGAEENQMHSIALAATSIFPTNDEWRVWLYSSGYASVADIQKTVEANGMSAEAFNTALCGLIYNNLIFLR